MSVVCRFGAYPGERKKYNREKDKRKRGFYAEAIWAGMILLAVCYGAVTGHMEEDYDRGTGRSRGRGIPVYSPW